MKAEINKYQQAYNAGEGVDCESRDALILKYAPFVKYIADRIAFRIPGNVSRDELISAGVVGLIDVLDKFDAGMGIKFKTYAEYRIKGAMLDELRKMDWFPRSVRKNLNRVEAGLMAARSRFGREPEDIEVAEEIGVDLDSYYKMLDKTKVVGILSLDEVLPNGLRPKFTRQFSSGRSPFEELKAKELKKTVADVLSTLPEKEQLVISLYYYEELTLKEIAKILNLTESRISQIHSKVIIKLKVKFKNFLKSET